MLQQAAARAVGGLHQRADRLVVMGDYRADQLLEQRVLVAKMIHHGRLAQAHVVGHHLEAGIREAVPGRQLDGGKHYLAAGLFAFGRFGAGFHNEDFTLFSGAGRGGGKGPSAA